MCRAGLAWMVNRWVLLTTGRQGAMDGSHIGRLERGDFHWPHQRYRSALREIFAAATDADLGFHIVVNRGTRAGRAGRSADE